MRLARAVASAATLAACLAACGPGLARSTARAPAGPWPPASSGVAPSARAAWAEPPPLRSSDPAFYVDPQGMFLVRFGAPASVEQKREPLGAGEIVTTTASLSSDARLMLAVKLEMTQVARYDCERGMDGMRDHTLANMGCAKTEEKRLEIRGRAAREILFSCDKRPMTGLMQLVCDDARVSSLQKVYAYELIAAYTPRSFDTAEARAFVQSFDLR